MGIRLLRRRQQNTAERSLECNSSQNRSTWIWRNWGLGIAQIPEYNISMYIFIYPIGILIFDSYQRWWWSVVVAYYTQLSGSNPVQSRRVVGGYYFTLNRFVDIIIIYLLVLNVGGWVYVWGACSWGWMVVVWTTDRHDARLPTADQTNGYQCQC